MNDTVKTFYVTTAIDYPNSAPHMGHAYEKVVADFYARAFRLQDYDTRFLIGLDEHGQKIQEAADASGKSPQSFVDEKAEVFRELYRLLNISYDDFVRTSEARHHSFCQDLFRAVFERGDIYTGHYEGQYCISCERFYTDTELDGGKCPIHDRETTTVQEESYFFRLSKYREALIEHIEEHPEFIYPVERRNEILARLADEVRDLSISRSTFDWGVPVPNDDKHVLYVWFDALSNYLSAITAPEDLTGRYWPANCHVIGKDINWFHSVIWPAMLMSAGRPLPKQVYVHGFILDADGKKMAKHLGNVVDPLQVVKEYSVETLRFYFLRCFASGQDGKFSVRELEDRYNSELGNELGNLVMRIAKLVVSRLGGKVATPGTPSDLDDAETIERFFAFVAEREHHRAMDTLWNYIKKTNAYLNEREPWKSRENAELEEVLGCGLEALRTIAFLLQPALPSAAAEIARTLGFELGSMTERDRTPRTYSMSVGDPMFPRREKPKAKPAEANKPTKQPKNAPVDPYAKLALKVGRIVTVEEHPEADALWVMQVDLAEEAPRSICAGLRAYLSADELRDRKVLVVANLKPAKLRGIESRGMILASDTSDGRVVPVDPGAAELGELAEVEGIESRPKSKLSKSDFDKAPLVVKDGQVVYDNRALKTSAGSIVCDAEDGATVR